MREFLKDSLAATGIFLFLFVFGGTAAVYLKDGRLAFDYYRIMQLLGSNVQYILVAILLSMIALIGLYRYFRYLMKQRLNCQVQYVDLETISAIWLEYNDMKENEHVAEQPSAPDTEQFDVTGYLIELQSGQAKDFYKQIIMPIMENLSETEKKIVMHLLVILDANGHIQSVASLFENDPEKLAYGKKITIDGKTSYQILKEYTLLDHSLRVARKAMDMIKDNQDGTYRLLRGQILVAALAHDIGKLKVDDVQIKEEIYRQNPHEQISVMIMQALYPDYEHAKNVYDAIRSHHIAKPSGKVAYLLKKADHAAREEEIHKWMVAHKTEWRDPGVIPAVTCHDEKAEQDSKTNPEKTAGKPTVITDKPAKTERNTERQKDSPEAVTGFLVKYGESLRSELTAKVNTVQKDDITNETKIVSVGFGDTVLYDYQAFKKTIEKITKKRTNKEKMLSIVKEMKDHGIVKMVDTEKGFFVSKFVVEDGLSKMDTSFVPVSCEYLGLSAEDIELDKRENPHLRNIRIVSYNRKKSVYH